MPVPVCECVRQSKQEIPQRALSQKKKKGGTTRERIPPRIHRATVPYSDISIQNPPKVPCLLHFLSATVARSSTLSAAVARSSTTRAREGVVAPDRTWATIGCQLLRDNGNGDGSELVLALVGLRRLIA